MLARIRCFVFSLFFLLCQWRSTFSFVNQNLHVNQWRRQVAATPNSHASTMSIDEATYILSEWDRNYSVDRSLASWTSDISLDDAKQKLPEAVICLNNKATEERSLDSINGRVMLGICASTAEEGLATLKSWVPTLGLPRGLLHGMDEDGVPLQLDGAVYIKYNSGGVFTFSDIRKSGIGFDAIWKPGDALLELYDGKYRGVYFQVELADGVFRQFLVPLDILNNGTHI
jgi:hypothetical protein